MLGFSSVDDKFLLSIVPLDMSLDIGLSLVELIMRTKPEVQTVVESVT